MAILLISILLGGIGMFTETYSERPGFYNGKALLGWFFISTSFWLVVLYTPVALYSKIKSLKGSRKDYYLD